MQQYYETITGGKLPAEMSHQELFDAVVTHLRRQKVRAICDGACVYQAPDGCRCAIGALLPDELVERAMAQPNTRIRFFMQDVNEVADWFGVARNPAVRDPRVYFLELLQGLHDRSEWSFHGVTVEGVFRRFARLNDLTYTPLVETVPA